MKSGDTVRVHVKVREGDKERIQVFEGMVIGMHRGGTARPSRSARCRSARASSASSRCTRRRSTRSRSMRVGAGPPREAVLPARPARQGRPHEGTEAHAPESRPGRCPCGPAADARRSKTALRRFGYPRVAGVDEVGRGCLAGPVAVGVVVLDPGRPHPRPARLEAAHARRARTALRRRITARGALAWAVGWAEPTEIDAVNIHQASLRAMARCVMALDPLPDVVLVDGISPSPIFPCRSGPSSAATGSARPSPPRRLWRRSLGTD